MGMPRSLQLAASLLALAAAASLTEPTQACTQPTVSITSPPDGALLSGLSTLAVSFVVHCAAFPGDVFVRLWEVSTRAADTFVDLIAPGDAYIMNIIEGTHFVTMSLHPVSDPNTTLHWTQHSFELVPVGAPAMDSRHLWATLHHDASLSAYWAAHGDGGTPGAGDIIAAITATMPQPPVHAARARFPLRVLVLGDTEVFDGMKTYFLDQMASFIPHGMVYTYLDSMCLSPDMDSNTQEAGYVDNTVTGRAMLAAGARLVRICPSVAAAHEHEFLEYTRFSGGLYSSTPTWAGVPSNLTDAFLQFAALFAEQDIVVGSWHDDFWRVGQGPWLVEVASVVNPAMARIIDLGPCALPLHPGIRVTDAWAAVSNYVNATRAAATTVPVLVLPPSVTPLQQQSQAEIGAGAALEESVCARAYGKRNGTFLVGYVARLVSSKSPGMFIRTALALSRQHPDLRFRFVYGGGQIHTKYQAVIEGLAASLGASHLVTFLGFLPRSELPQLYSCLDAVLFTSMTQFETFGIVNLEAMSLGLSVVHFGTAGLQDYFIDGYNSVLVKAYDPDAAAEALYPLLVNDTLREYIGSNARSFFHRFLSANVTVDRAAIEYRRLVALAQVRAATGLWMSVQYHGAGTVDAPWLSVNATYCLYLRNPTDTPLTVVNRLHSVVDAEPEGGFTNSTAEPYLTALVSEAYGGCILCVEVKEVDTSEVAGALCEEWRTPEPFTTAVPLSLVLPLRSVQLCSWLSCPNRQGRRDKGCLTIPYS